MNLCTPSSFCFLSAAFRLSAHALVLQLELGFCSSQSPFVMIRLSNGLMVTPKERPGKGLSVCDRLRPDRGPDQAWHLWEGVGVQQTTNLLRCLNCCKLLEPQFGSQAFFSGSALACSAINVAHNWATRESVTCRYQPVQDLTSY